MCYYPTLEKGALMKINELYREIKEKLSPSSLHKLTLALLEAKKKSNTVLLQSIHCHIFPEESSGRGDGNRLFMDLIRVVHPDRFEFISAELETAREKKDRTALEFYSRVLSASDLTEPVSADPARFEYSPDESWSYGREDFDGGFTPRADDCSDYSVREENADYDFIRAVQSEYLGSMEVQFNSSDLAALTGEVDLSDYGIIDLDGLEYCQSVTHLNLTHNRIDNIHEILSLYSLKELYLGDNMITDISGLEGLEQLEILDISNNDIEDISPLLNLPKLEFVNTEGNPVRPNSVVRTLKERGVFII